jgi:hypothetical protein
LEDRLAFIGIFAPALLFFKGDTGGALGNGFVLARKIFSLLFNSNPLRRLRTFSTLLFYQRCSALKSSLPFGDWPLLSFRMKTKNH